MTDEVKSQVDFIKVDDSLGLIMGWAMICSQKGEPYYDLHNDHIPEDAMLEASVDFMKNSRVLGDQHEKPEGGSVLFAWPMTTEVAKAFGITTEKTGLMIAVKPDSPEMLAKFKAGEMTGFSIGFRRVKDEVVA